MDIVKLKSTWRDNEFAFDQASNAKIDFKSVRELQKFLKGDTSFCIIGISHYKIIKITKVRHTSILAKVEKITLREYNLERILL